MSEKTKLDVLRAKLYAKDIRPSWTMSSPYCTFECPSYRRESGRCFVTDAFDPGACGPTIDAMVEALQVPHE